MKSTLTIDELAQITEERIQGVEKETREGFRSVNDSLKENFGLVLHSLDGLRDDVKQARGASNLEYALLRQKVESLESDVERIKQKVGFV
jgi:hypothetical protein